MSNASKVIAQTDRHTHKHDENVTFTTYVGSNEVSRSTATKVIAWTDTYRHTHRHYGNITSTAYAVGKKLE